MRSTALIAVLCVVVAGPLRAQREFVEELQPAEAVDLDAPDPALGRKPPPPPAPVPAPVVPPPAPAPVPVTPPATTPPPTTTTTPTTPPNPVVPPAAGADESGPSFTIVTSDRVAFLEKVHPHFLAAQQKDGARARKALTGVQLGAVEAAVAGLPEGFSAPAVAMALVREARVAVDAGSSDDATELVEQALVLAPSDLGTMLGVARVRLDVGGVGAALNTVPDVARAVAARPIDLGNVVARAVAAVLLAILLTLAVVVGAVVVPALRMVAFDLATRLPRGVHPAQALFLVVIVAALPLGLGAGWLAWLLWVAAIGMVGLAVRQRVVVVVASALALTSPLLVDLLARAWTIGSAPASQLHTALYDIDGDGAVKELLAREAAGEALSLPASVAVANAARRQGRVDEAVTRYKALVDKHGDVSWVHGGYAVALATAGNADLALAEFGVAVEKARLESGGGVVIAPAAFNASLLHHAAGRREKAQVMLTSVTEVGADTLARLRRATFRAVDEVVHHNRAFAEVLPPRRVLLAETASPAAASLALTIGEFLWRAPPGGAWPMLGGLFGLMVLLALVASRVETACPCGRCGDPSSRRVDGAEVPRGTCAACYHAFISTKSRVDGSVRVRKENAIRRRAMRRARLILALTVWPGAGHLFAGAVVRGGILSMAAVVSAAAMLGASDVWPGPRLVDLPAWLLMVPAGLAFVVTLALAVRGAVGLSDEEKGALR